MYSLKLNCESSVNISEQMYCNELTFVSFCDQNEVSYAVEMEDCIAVTIEVCEELLQVMMLVVHNSIERTDFRRRLQQVE